ncbi:hypothetical protein BASA81_006917 [Batrachochytrium salamandrivorans]|nr:hypothetical protein BASA81_006917 [Batrachochytrium salamandrivorans]
MSTAPPPETELAAVLSPLLTPEDGIPVCTSQSTLFLARNLAGDTVVLKRTIAKSKDLLASAQTEVSLLRKIRHPNIVAFCGVWTKPLAPGSEINLLLELCAGGNLLDLQRRREQSLRNLTEQEIIRLFVQCCKGVECLHRFDPPVAHRDVKLENLLLGGPDGRTVKLCDFGSATTRRVLVVSREDRIKLEDEVVRLTTPAYRAPELVDFYSRKLVSEQVDVWALGCVLFALGFSRHLFGEEGNKLAILSGNVAVPPAPYYSDEFQLLLHWLLEGDPNIRPRIGDVVDELDLLLGNKVKIPADKRGSGSGLHRSSCKAASLVPRTESVPVKRVSVATPTVAATTATPGRGAAYAPTMPPKPPVPTPPTIFTSNNPFDSLPPPSHHPTFFSNPGMTSDSLTGYPNVDMSSHTHFPSTTSMASQASSTPPSQAPIFFSDPPPQWRKG